MIVEQVDKRTGAILYVEDEETLTIRSLVERVSKLEEEVRNLKSYIRNNEEDSNK